MKAIIPVAGYGSRLRPHTFTVPKALLPIAGRPILDYIVEQVISWGASELTIIYGHLGEQIEEFLKLNYKIEVEFRAQKDPLGLGHAIFQGLDEDDKDVLVILGDTIIDADMKRVIERGVTSIGVCEVEDPKKLGVVVIDNGRVVRLVEKPTEPLSNLAIVGAYYIRDASLLRRAIQNTFDNKITVKGEYQVTDALQLMLEWGETIETFPVNSWFDCGKPETLLETNKYFLQQRRGNINSAESVDSIIIPPVVLGEGSEVIRSVVGPFVSVGRNSIILETVIKNSIIGDKAVVSQVLLEDTIIGNRAEISGHMQKINLGTSSLLKL